MNRVLMRKLAVKIVEEADYLLGEAAKYKTTIGDNHMTASIVLTHLAKAIIKTEEEL